MRSAVSLEMLVTGDPTADPHPLTTAYFVLRRVGDKIMANSDFRNGFIITMILEYSESMHCIQVPTKPSRVRNSDADNKLSLIPLQTKSDT